MSAPRLQTPRSWKTGQRSLAMLREYRYWCLIALLVAFCLGVTLAVPHTDPDGARGWLEGKGYSAVQITGFSWFSCDETALTHTGYRALGPDGKPVSGTVCWSPLWGNWLSWI